MSPATVPTRVRYRVLSFGVALAAITYMDRVAIANLAKLISKDLELTDVQMGYVFSAFTLAYGLFEIPTGWWGDKVGTRRVLMRIVSWWSAFTMATAAAFNYASLLAIRFLFGAGEAGAWPNAAKTFSRWFPVTERGTAQGIFFMGAHFGAAYSPLLIQFLLAYLSWRGIFIAFGLVGFVWAALWYWWFRDDPAEHPSVNAAERDHITQGRGPEASHDFAHVPWGRIFSDRNVLLLCLMYFVQTYGFYFYITWLPTYLERVRGFSSTELSLFAGAPMVACMIADVTGGLATDLLTRKFGLRLGRAITGGSSFLFAAIFTVIGAAAKDPTEAAILLSIAAGWSVFCLGAAWGACLDIAGSHAGVVSACMNTAGQVGGFLSPIILANLVRAFNNDWSPALYLSGALFLIGALCWLLIDPRRPIRLSHQP
jgi:MFS transporter, ACS family, glucarate transporter